MRQRPTLRPPSEGLRERRRWRGAATARAIEARDGAVTLGWRPVLDGLSFREHAVGWGTGTGLLGRRELPSPRRDRVDVAERLVYALMKES